jgi:hypothetical protein
MIEEVRSVRRSPSGEYRDVLVGRDGKVIWECPWQSNLIVDGMSRLLAALVKGDSQGRPVNWWAVGTGMESWDRSAPDSDPAWTRLQNETTRRELIPDKNIRFLGGIGHGVTNRLEISMTFFAANSIMPLREFGLFAGGNEKRESGLMINHRIHPRIDLQPGFRLQRTLHFTF